MDVETIAPGQLWKLFILDSVQGVELGYDVRSARMRIWLLFRTTSSSAEARSSSGAIESRYRSSSAILDSLFFGFICGYSDSLVFCRGMCRFLPRSSLLSNPSTNSDACLI